MKLVISINKHSNVYWKNKGQLMPPNKKKIEESNLTWSISISVYTRCCQPNNSWFLTSSCSSWNAKTSQEWAALQRIWWSQPLTFQTLSVLSTHIILQWQLGHLQHQTIQWLLLQPQLHPGPVPQTWLRFYKTITNLYFSKSKKTSFNNCTKDHGCYVF